MALYHKWDVKNDFFYVLQFFSLISDSLGSVQYNIAPAGLILPTICFVFATFPICKLCHQLLSELQQKLVQIGKKQRNQSMQLGPSEVLES